MQNHGHQHHAFGATPTQVLCCICGTPIAANPSGMCVQCLQTQVDITSDIPKQQALQFCKFCGRYLQPPKHWVQCELESRELLTLCLKRVRGLNKVRLVDASFIWTEPHSRRIKLKLTVQGEALGAILQQTFVIEFVVQNQMCTDCQRADSKQTWRAVVQVRQRVDHKRTFLYLEQLLLRHNAHKQANNVQSVRDGIDFFFDHKNQAQSFVDFLGVIMPIRSNYSNKLVSADLSSNIANYKHNLSVELPPLCKDDLICLPKRLAQQMGNLSQLVLCWRVSNLVHVVDPSTMQATEVNAQVYWRSPFFAIADSRMFTEYVVIDIEVQGSRASKFAPAEAIIARVHDFGVNDIQFTVRTHLGSVLQPGDLVYGYDISCMNVNNSDFDTIPTDRLPEVILVRKSYSNRRRRRRLWKLRRMPMEEEQAGNRPQAATQSTNDMELFLRDLEEDPDLRQTIHVYRDAAVPVAAEEMQAADDDFAPAVHLAEMLDEMSIRDDPPINPFAAPGEPLFVQPDDGDDDDDDDGDDDDGDDDGDSPMRH